MSIVVFEIDIFNLFKYFIEIVSNVSQDIRKDGSDNPEKEHQHHIFFVGVITFLRKKTWMRSKRDNRSKHPSLGVKQLLTLHSSFTKSGVKVGLYKTIWVDDI